MSTKYPELKTGQSVLVTKTGHIEWVSSIVTSEGGDPFYKTASTKLLSTPSKGRSYNKYWSILPRRFDVAGARVVELTKEDLEIIRVELRVMLQLTKSIVQSIDEVFLVYMGNKVPELLDKHSEKLPELRSEFKAMITAALHDNKKIKLHTSEQANRLHKKDFVYLMLEPGSTKASIDEGLKNWKLVS